MRKYDESSLIADLTCGWGGDGSVIKGVGDDCAVLQVPIGKGGRELLLKTDAVVEGVHFLAETPGVWVGRKAIARVLSDFAAMGGVPWAAVVTLGMPLGTGLGRLRAVYRGMNRIASEYGLYLVGGETVRTRELVLSVSALGKAVYPLVFRSGAKAGDDLFVTGYLGEGWPRKHLRFVPRLAEGQWLARHGFASAMMDVSDGLGVDLVRLAMASDVGVDLDEGRIPRREGISIEQAMEAGEDYELVFSVPREKVKRLEALWPFRTRLTKIGFLTGKFSDMLRRWKWRGYDHVRNVS